MLDEVDLSVEGGVSAICTLSSQVQLGTVAFHTNLESEAAELQLGSTESLAQLHQAELKLLMMPRTRGWRSGQSSNKLIIY